MGDPEEATGSYSAMLVCSAYHFYPEMIKVSWYKDGKEVMGTMITSEELSDGGWYYQIHSHLDFTPLPGEKISCVVEHVSLKKPLEIVWGMSNILLGLLQGYLMYMIKSVSRSIGGCLWGYSR